MTYGQYANVMLTKNETNKRGIPFKQCVDGIEGLKCCTLRHEHLGDTCNVQ
jgi:hypothetical protein